MPSGTFVCRLAKCSLESTVHVSQISRMSNDKAAHWVRYHLKTSWSEIFIAPIRSDIPCGTGASKTKNSRFISTDLCFTIHFRNSNKGWRKQQDASTSVNPTISFFWKPRINSVSGSSIESRSVFVYLWKFTDKSSTCWIFIAATTDIKNTDSGLFGNTSEDGGFRGMRYQMRVFYGSIQSAVRSFLTKCGKVDKGVDSLSAA